MTLSPSRIIRWLLPALVVLAALTAFSPVLYNDFVDWDDQTNFVKNTGFRGLGWPQLVWMATTFHLGVYQPLAWLAIAVEYMIGGLNPMVYHAASWLFHATTAGLVYSIAVLLIGRDGASPHRARLCAAAAALIFAVHPQRVEAVAWASAQGYPLAGIFAAGSIAAYLRAHPPDASASTRWNGWMSASLVLAILAYFSKPIAVTLPAILVLLDGYPLRRWQRGHALRVALEKLPYCVPAAVIAAAAPLARTHIGLLEGDHSYGLLFRIGQAAYGLLFYLWKTIAPFNLTFYYSLPVDADPLQSRFVISAICVLVLAGALWWVRRRWPGLVAAALAYTALLSPILGVIPQGGTLAADRYAYFAAVPVALVLGGALYASQGWVERMSWRPWATVGALAVLTITLGVPTWRQVEVWRDSGTLWAHAVMADPEAFQSHNFLGLYFLRRGEYAAALREFDATLHLKPDSANGHFNRGLALAKLGRAKEALVSYRQGLALHANDPTAHAHVAELLVDDRRFSEAEREYRIAATLSPHSDLFNSLGIVLAQQGRLAEAAAEFQRALQLDPSHADARANLEMAIQMGQSQ